MTAAGRWCTRIVLTGVLPIVCLALLLAALHGAIWGWVVAASGLMLVVLLQTRRLALLAAWIDGPQQGEVPDSGGAWGEVFRKLSRKLRLDARALAEVEARLGSFSDAMDAVPDGLVVLSENHQVQWANRAAGEHLGIRLPRDGGAIIQQLVRAPGFAEYLSSPAGQPPFILLSPAARRRAYSLRAVPLGERNTLLVSLDVTDARRVEAMRSTFVANVSHELRTPLTVVSGFLEHFGDESAMSAEQRQQFVRLMSEQTRRMLSLVDDLLTLSRLEAEDAPASEEDIDMADLLAQLQAEAEGLSCGRHRLQFRCGGPGLRGNRHELHSAFGNLVSNAIRYTPAGGDIRVRWKLRAGVAVFSVRDSGVGIAAEHLPRLTERFYRVDRGRSRDTGGTGLGLAIVKHILLRHQAVLVIDSQPGVGSNFRAEFPEWRLRPQPSPALPAADEA
ncbi:phosphate regulon sensor histidine kinase PhoR [Accumulibacter sp.]|uniref:phosphate regulon sensor histidine kinase PhoR n=1 Tax=Accumulibacter sp. TaxID=2053492 RepID=UPI0025D5028C|nr:phosphate regulon sensor histidine kinase PhoR [Accumulibacter sp.]MCM8613679.1 phosphate regulon sensor histidine kinase PhoR [Accumulibacter sp.]MCM8637964.1 phosphate regulon sensor histidine kinase PhoR [Accumulibacter sp.]MCM8641245.1 phosphate regulon sensor histidine kinase PhoR [Accumulibacter sp.]